ncbi:MAG: metalloregulator ArsR/SmtB family transcription factor [Gemmatimonadota bacterium]
MPNQFDLDQLFSALANPTRREVLEALRNGPQSVSELAAPHDMALPSFMQHLQQLEDAGLVRSEKTGRVRTVEACKAPMLKLETWLDEQRIAWEGRLNQLDDFVTKEDAR